MFIDYLNKDISHVNRLPQIVEEEQKFTEFITLLSNYIDESSAQIYAVLENIVPIIGSAYSDDISITYLRRLVDKFGIKLPFTGSSLTENQLRLLYFTAIQGFSLQRISDSSKSSMVELLSTLYPSEQGLENQIEVSDGGVGGAVMTYTATIKNFSASAGSEYLSKYLQPTITGVGSTLNFNYYGSFSAMFWNQDAETAVPAPVPTGTQYRELTTSFMWAAFNYETKQEYTIEHTPGAGENPPYRAANTGIWRLEIND